MCGLPSKVLRYAKIFRNTTFLSEGNLIDFKYAAAANDEAKISSCNSRNWNFQNQILQRTIKQKQVFNGTRAQSFHLWNAKTKALELLPVLLPWLGGVVRHEYQTLTLNPKPMQKDVSISIHILYPVQFGCIWPHRNRDHIIQIFKNDTKMIERKPWIAAGRASPGLLQWANLPSR